ncbi:DNA-directed RNA polymerase V subunit 1 [Phalaenopsis equestris]|uniref:DNA-directed RNA polymerase V subunit 1 n=1 Tax=Phalaenopsis equestris TaxID=78828 RepID=UPI0009E34D29|nr:DNA-directed RNA polymerase V subunit 1 [Phalaenopsis equestris]
MEEDINSFVSSGVVSSISFSLASFDEVSKYSINNCPISHPSQLGNPFLGLPLESGRCESCGTVETEKCEGHFGYVEFPIPIYHPSHISELKNILTLLCLRCLRVKKGKIKCETGKEKISIASCTYCREIQPVSVIEVNKTDGAVGLELRVTTPNRLREGYWNFLDRFGFHHSENGFQSLHPLEVIRIFNEIPEETRRRLSAKGFFPHTGFIIQYFPVPPNCLSLPQISDGKIIMSSDNSKNLLRRIFTSIEKIKTNHSSCIETPESDLSSLQVAVARYLSLRGVAKVPHDINGKLKISVAAENPSKQWLDKMRTLFISKGSGFSSRSVITGDPYIGIDVIGLPSEIAKKVTFEERVSVYNLERLQKMVNNRLCVAYTDGETKFSIETSAEGHVKLKVGQIVCRRIMDGDVVFLNRPPSTHKHSVQAFYVSLHDENVVKINPLVCSPIGADFDGDCVHIFYPQSLAAKAEAIELFSVEKQLLSSHNDLLNMQFVQDSLLSLRLISNACFLTKMTAQQLSMFVPRGLPSPAFVKAHNHGPFWTIFQVLQCAFPASLDCSGDRHSISGSEILHVDFKKDMIHASLVDMVSSVLSFKGSKEGLVFLNTVQPLLMEMLNVQGFSINLQDFDVPKDILEDIHFKLQEISCLLSKPRSSYREGQDLQVEDLLKILKFPITDFILKTSSVGTMIDSKSESSIFKVLQQLGFLGLELFERGKLYSKTLVQDVFSYYLGKHSIDGVGVPSEACGLVKGSFFGGLNPYEDFVHSICTREVIVRSSRGLTEPGTLFKNLMAILRDVVVCYDGTVRNVCRNFVIQFQYRVKDDIDTSIGELAGEPVGVLAATAISNPAYKAVLDSSLSTNSSWELMKEILLSKVGYQNVINDRRVVLYLNDCLCGKRFCKEMAAFAVQDCLKKFTLRDCASEFTIEYKKQIVPCDGLDAVSGLVGHIHLDKGRLKAWNTRIEEILPKCQEIISGSQKKKGPLSFLFKGIVLSTSECCQQPHDATLTGTPCLQFYFDIGGKIPGESLDRLIHIMANVVCPMLLETIIKGDSRVDSANIIWVEPTNSSSVRDRRPLKGELAIEIFVGRSYARQNGDAWRTVLDACLPVMHLIDTRRSVPYGIKQVEDLLGISCSFEQSVQRLSASIKMVAKGVLKEHLILVANSMTCTGSLLGFNNSGFKKLLRSLNVQMPFTEATLFTPIKCFERAAQKCHTDTLTSIVSSCLWGKHVAVGTGSCFKVFWDKQQVKANQDVEKDVYDFLELVQTASAEKEVDVDDLMYESEYEFCASPVSGIHIGKETYNDGNDSLFHSEILVQEREDGNKLNWESGSESSMKPNSWQGWESKKKPDKLDSQSSLKKDGAWSGWDIGNEKESTKYGSQTPEVQQGWGGSSKPPSVDTGNSERVDNGKQWNENSEANGAWPSSGWGLASESNVSKTWNSSNKPAWNSDMTSKAARGNGHNAEKANFGRSSESNDWNENRVANHRERDWNLTDASKSCSSSKPVWNTDGLSKGGAWSSFKHENIRSERSFQSDKWNENNNATDHGDSAWGSTGESESWKSPAKTILDTDGTSKAGAWDSPKTEMVSFGRSSELNNWNEKGATDNGDSSWGYRGRGSTDAACSNWKSTCNTHNNDARANVESSNVEKLDETKAADNGNSGWKSRGWGSTDGRRTWKNSSARTGIKSDEQRGRNAIGSSNMKRNAELLTHEEEQILFEVEPVFCSAKKILHDASVGQPLSTEHQQVIKEQVFEYHPDKDGKLSGGQIDHIMVDKHETFTDSKCFFVVSTDGSRSDFSYIKCLMNLIKQKFPEHGASFNSKYFRKRSSAPTDSTQQ